MIRRSTARSVIFIVPARLAAVTRRSSSSVAGKQLHHHHFGAGSLCGVDQSSDVVVVDAVGVDERGHDIQAFLGGSLDERHSKPLNQSRELRCAEAEQAQRGVDGEVVVEDPNAVAVSERPGHGELASARRPIDQDVFAAAEPRHHPHG